MVTSKRAKKTAARRTTNPSPKLKPQRQKAFLEHLAKTANITVSCRSAGISRKQYYVWMKDEKFAERAEHAMDDAIDMVEFALMQQATGYLEPVYYQGEVVGDIRKRDTRAAEILLKGRRAQVFRERHDIEHSGEVNTRVVEVPVVMTADDWAAAAKAQQQVLQESIASSGEK